MTYRDPRVRWVTYRRRHVDAIRLRRLWARLRAGRAIKCPHGHNDGVIYPCEPTRVRCRLDDRMDGIVRRMAAGMRLDGRRSRYSQWCKRGHPLTAGNVYRQPSTGRRRCRTCNNVRAFRNQRTAILTMP